MRPRFQSKLFNYGIHSYKPKISHDPKTLLKNGMLTGILDLVCHSRLYYCTLSICIWLSRGSTL